MKLVHGIGINDVDYDVKITEAIGYVDGRWTQRHVWQCPSHRDWSEMLKRCHSKKFKQEHPTYKDTACIDDWIRLSLFNAWRYTQGDVMGKHLDKDIIVPGNKLYSPETCAYVNGMTNKFVEACDASRGEWPLGVSWHKGGKKFIAACSNPFTKKGDYLGLFIDPLEAHEAWRRRKHELAQLVATTESDPRVVEALKKRYSAEEWYREVHE